MAQQWYYFCNFNKREVRGRVKCVFIMRPFHSRQFSRPLLGIIIRMIVSSSHCQLSLATVILAMRMYRIMYLCRSLGANRRPSCVAMLKNCLASML